MKLELDEHEIPEHLREYFEEVEETPIKEKSALGLPWRLAMALQAAGWYLRSEIIWHKLNPLPESVLDRPTKAHEQVFLLTKQPRYFYDAEAVRQPHSRAWIGQTPFTIKVNPDRNDLGQRCHTGHEAGRNLRSVLSLASEPVKFAHFACFPQKLVEPCVLAGSSPQVCSACGSPWRRVVEHTGAWRAMHERPAKHNGAIYRTNPGGGLAGVATSRQAYTTGLTPGCSCNAGTVPATVLDPFVGSGTTCLTALQHGRASIGIDLNATYLDLAVQRLTPALAQLPLFGLPTAPESRGHTAGGCQTAAGGGRASALPLPRLE